MASGSPRRPRDLDLAELGRSLPAIEVDPAVAHFTTAPGGYGVPEARPREMARGVERLEDGRQVSAVPREFPLGPSPVLLDDTNREFYETAMSATAEIERDIEGHIQKIRELNATLSEDQHFFPIIIVPRCPKLLIVADYYEDFCLDETCPTTFGPKRFAKPGDVGRYGATTMLQFFSLKFAGNFPNDQPMFVYGFMAVRDDVEPLRNYIFNRTRENPCEVKPGSPILHLMCPARGISVFIDSMVEYSLKIKLNGGDGGGDEDVVLIDGCIEYSEESIRRDRKLKSRIDGPFGPVDMEYAFIRHGIEAVVEITLPNYFVGDHVKVTAFTSGYTDPIVLYDGHVRKHSKLSSVVAVSLGGQLKIKFEATIYDSDPCDNAHWIYKEFEKEMLFKAQEYGSSKGKFKLLDVPIRSEKHFSRQEGGFVTQGRLCRVVAVKVTWSTMGY